MKTRMNRRAGPFTGDPHGRTLLLSAGSFGLNALIGAGKLAAGVFLRSPWMIATGTYYLLLCAARGQVLWKIRKIRKTEEPAERSSLRLRLYRRGGAFLCLIGLSYCLVCLCMYRLKIETAYPFYIQYGAAAVAFYKVGMAVYGMAACRKKADPVLSTLKIISFADACVSIVAVQNALLTMKGSAAASSSSAFFGMGCSVLFLVIGIRMLCRPDARVVAPDGAAE